MTDVQAAKLRAHAERTMDRIWPEWRNAPEPDGETGSRSVHEAIKGAVQYGFDTAERSSAVANEEEVQRRIRVVTEKHAADLDAVRATLSKRAEDAANAARDEILRGVRGLGQTVAQKHGDLALPTLLVRLIELGIVNAKDGSL